MVDGGDEDCGVTDVLVPLLVPGNMCAQISQVCSLKAELKLLASHGCVKYPEGSPSSLHCRNANLHAAFTFCDCKSCIADAPQLGVTFSLCMFCVQVLSHAAALAVGMPASLHCTSGALGSH
jgi:hypothetical protein